MVDYDRKKEEELFKKRYLTISEIKNSLKKVVKNYKFELNEKNFNEILEKEEEKINKIIFLNKELAKLWGNNYESENPQNILKAILKSVFEELKFLVKNKKEYENEYIIFRYNENVLISFLIEYFRDIMHTKESQIFLKLRESEMKEYMKFFDVDINFIDKLKKEGILEEYWNDEKNFFISFFDCYYSSEKEKIIRMILLSNYNLKKNKDFFDKTMEIKKEYTKFSSKIKKLQKDTNLLQKSLNNSKIEGIAILTIFISIYSYLSTNLDITKNLLSQGAISKNAIIIFTISLIPIVTMFLLLKYLFLNQKDKKLFQIKKENNSKSKDSKNFFIKIIFFLIFIVGICLYKSLKNDLKQKEEQIYREVLMLKEENMGLKFRILNLEMKEIKN